jgi:hypothetical protein
MIQNLNTPQKVLLASSSGLVLLLGFLALKARAAGAVTPEQQQELLTLSDTLKEDSSSLSDLAHQLGGAEGEQVEAIRKHIDNLSDKLSAGNVPSEEEVNKINQQLGTLSQQLAKSQNSRDGDDTSAENLEPKSGFPPTKTKEEETLSTDIGSDLQGASEPKPDLSAQPASSAESNKDTSEPNQSSEQVSSAKGKSNQDAQSQKQENDLPKSKEQTNSSSPTSSSPSNQSIDQMDTAVNETETVLAQMPTVIDEISNSFSKFEEDLDTQTQNFDDSQLELTIVLEKSDDDSQNHQTQMSTQQNAVSEQFQLLIEQFGNLIPGLEQSFSTLDDTERVLGQEVELAQKNTEKLVDEYTFLTSNFIQEIINVDASFREEEVEIANKLAVLQQFIEDNYTELEQSINQLENQNLSTLNLLKDYQNNMTYNLQNSVSDFLDQQLVIVNSSFQDTRASLDEIKRKYTTNLSFSNSLENIKSIFTELKEYLEITMVEELEHTYHLTDNHLLEVIEHLDVYLERSINHHDICEFFILISAKIKQSADIIADINSELSHYSL